MPRDYFGQDVAGRYDESAGSMFEPRVLDPTVDVLAELAGSRAALEFAVGTGRVALPLAARGIAVSGIEFSTAMAERLHAKDPEQRIQVTIGDMTDDASRRRVRARLPRVQHHREREHPGPTGRVLRQRIGPSRAWRLLRGRSRGAPAAQPPTRRGRSRLLPRSRLRRLRPLRRLRRAASRVAPLLRRRIRRSRVPHAVPLCVAVRARPHGEARGPLAASSVGGLGPSPLHGREHVPTSRCGRRPSGSQETVQPTAAVASTASAATARAHR